MVMKHWSFNGLGVFLLCRTQNTPLHGWITVLSPRNPVSSGEVPSLIADFLSLIKRIDHAARGRCKDESGQLNARVLGIKKVRHTVTEGWRAVRGGGDAAGEGSTGSAQTGASENGDGKLAEGAVSGKVETAVAQPQGVQGVGGALPKGVGGKAAPGYNG